MNIPLLFTFDIYKVRRTLMYATSCSCPESDDDEKIDCSRRRSKNKEERQRPPHDDQGGGQQNEMIQLEKFGHKVHWIPGLHYSKEELEPHRLIGDVELDPILDITWNDDDTTTSDKTRSDGGRFSNTIQDCATLYLQYREEIMRTMRQQTSDNTEASSTTYSNTNTTDNLPVAASTVLDYNKKEMAMYKFYHHYHDLIPSWVNWEQIQRGIDVFILYAPVAGQALFYLSLVPGFSIPKIAKVLQQTRYLAPPSTAQQVKNRLMDTGGFLASVMAAISSSADHDEHEHEHDNKLNLPCCSSSLRPGGKGWTMALQVRLLHAKVRRSILHKKLKHNRNHPNATRKEKELDDWNLDEYGVPINQEDMAATLLAFSINVLMGIEFVAGRPLSYKDQIDYLALWRYIGWLLGIRSWEGDKQQQDDEDGDEDTMPRLLDPCGPKIQGDKMYNELAHAHASLESFILHLMHPNKSSIEIAHHLLHMGGGGGGKSATKIRRNHKTTVVVDETFAFLYRSFMCRRYIGNELADALQLPKPSNSQGIKSMIAYSMTWIVLFMLRIYTLLTMKSLWFQKIVYVYHAHLLMKFEKMWSKNHKERMIQSEQQSGAAHGKSAVKVPSPLSSSSLSSSLSALSEKHETHLNKVAQGDLQSSFCPFGLVMPPTDVQDDVESSQHVKMD